MIVPGNAPTTPDVGGRADSCALIPRVTTAGAPSCRSTTIIAASMPSISMAASSTRSMSSSRSIESPSSPNSRFRRLSCSARSSASDSPPASSSIFVRISSTARTSSSFCGGVVGARRLRTSQTRIAAATRTAAMITNVIATCRASSSGTTSPCTHANGGCNLDRGTPFANVLGSVDASRYVRGHRPLVRDGDDDRAGTRLSRLPERVLRT